jgi:hypothetical protein
MHRLAGICVVLAACSSGTGTGAATLMGPTVATNSATATPFFDVDAGGTKIRGWTIDFFEAKAGADCTDNSLKVSASLGIWTNQPADGNKVGTLQSAGQISIITMNPPMINGDAVAIMGAEGIGQIVGIVQIDEFHLDAGGKPDKITGEINAGGLGNDGGSVNVTGMFTAPVCN